MPIWYRNFDVSKCVPNVISNTVFETLFFKLVSFVQKRQILLLLLSQTYFLAVSTVITYFDQKFVPILPFL